MKFPAVFSTLLATASAACALTIQVDYTYDAAAGNFFGRNPLAKAAVNKAAADLSAAITSGLGGVPDDVFTGTSGRTSVEVDWNLEFENPSAPGQYIELENFSLQADVFTIYVGMQALGGSTIGQGGPTGVSISTTGSGFPNEIVGAVASMESGSNGVLPRGGGPIMGSISGSLTLGTTASYTLEYGALLGTLSFDIDTNNDGKTDSDATLANFWHYDPNTQVASGKNDLYSVALHEILHTLGVGTSDTWSSLVSGTTWLGDEASAINGGSGANLINGSGDHLRSGLISARLSDGVLQEVVMDPSITVGQRKYLTHMDLAFLKDIGYSTTAVPEPSTALLIVSGLGLLSLRRVRRA